MTDHDRMKKLLEAAQHAQAAVRLIDEVWESDGPGHRIAKPVPYGRVADAGGLLDRVIGKIRKAVDGFRGEATNASRY